MIQLELILWAAQFVLIPYALLKRKDDLLCSSVVLFFILLIPIFIGINTPNPDHVTVIQVITP